MLLKDAEIYLICNPFCNQIWNCTDMFKLKSTYLLFVIFSGM